MAKEIKYTAEQLKDAEKLAEALASLPEDKRGIVIMMTNSFIAGMEAQEAIENTTKLQRWLSGKYKEEQNA